MTGGISQNPEPAWATRLDYRAEPNCTGTLIAPTWVVTAAHCLVNDSGRKLTASRMVARFRGRPIRAAELYPHPSYRRRDAVVFPDIGLIRLTADATSIQAVPAPLGTAGDMAYFRNRGITLFGYGRDESGAMTSRIKKTRDHAWFLAKGCQFRRMTCMRRADWAKRVTRVTGGDSGGPWMGWRNGGWRVLAVVSGYPAVDPDDEERFAWLQAGTSPAEPSLAQWIAAHVWPVPTGPAGPSPSDAGEPGSPVGDAPTPPGSSLPAGSVPETTGGPTNTWTNPANAGGAQGPTIPGGQTVGIACKLQGFKVANGNPWWYRIASAPWSGQYYASADAFYNNGQTSGSLAGTPWVDPAVPDCAAPPPPPPPPPPANHVEQQGSLGANTFTNPYNASGMGPKIPAMGYVEVSCKVYAPQIASANPDGYWYRIASSPWNNAYYAVANTFWNGDIPGQLPYTHNTDWTVPNC